MPAVRASAHAPPAAAPYARPAQGGRTAAPPLTLARNPSDAVQSIDTHALGAQATLKITNVVGTIALLADGYHIDNMRAVVNALAAEMPDEMAAHAARTAAWRAKNARRPNPVDESRGPKAPIRYNPKRFSAIVWRVPGASGSMLLFASGKMIVNGARSVGQAKSGAEEAARRLQRAFARVATAALTDASAAERAEAGRVAMLRVRLGALRVTNMVAAAPLGFEVHPGALADDPRMRAHSSFDPEVFPGVIHKNAAVDGSVGINVFHTGKVVVYGATKPSQLRALLARLAPVILDHRCPARSGEPLPL